MNLPSLIDTFRRCLPGWEPPTELMFDSKAALVYFDGEDEDSFVCMKSDHAAAIIAASVKEWLQANRKAAFGVGCTWFPDRAVWTAQIDGTVHQARSELEALAAAVEAMKGGDAQ